MALTLEAEQRMEDVGIGDFYRDYEAEWLATAKATKRFIRGNFPPDSPIRRDDVAKALIPILEVHEDFKEFRNREKLRQKFWVRDLADLIIDKTWDQLDEDGEADGEDRAELENN